MAYAEVVRGVCQLVEEWVRGGEAPKPRELVAVKRRDGVRIERFGGGVVLPVGKGDADRGYEVGVARDVVSVLWERRCVRMRVQGGGRG